MAKYIKLSAPEFGITDGMQLTFRAPCVCTDVDGISIEGYDTNFTLVDSLGMSLRHCSFVFEEGSMLSVILDTVNKTATLLNPGENYYTSTLGDSGDAPSRSKNSVWARVNYILDVLNDKANCMHSHSKSQITDFAHNHDERYYTEDEIDQKLDEKSNLGHNHDGRYYHVDVIDDKMRDKSDVGHTHTKSDIADFPTSMPASDVYPWAKAPAKPTYTASEVGASPLSHTHNDIKEVLNLTINYAKGKTVRQSASGTSSSTKDSFGYHCTLTFTFSSLTTVESYKVVSISNFNSDYALSASGNVLTLSGYSDSPLSQCSATVECLLAPNLMA